VIEEVEVLKKKLAKFHFADHKSQTGLPWNKTEYFAVKVWYPSELGYDLIFFNFMKVNKVVCGLEMLAYKVTYMGFSFQYSLYVTVGLTMHSHSFNFRTVCKYSPSHKPMLLKHPAFYSSVPYLAHSCRNGHVFSHLWNQSESVIRDKEEKQRTCGEITEKTGNPVRQLYNSQLLCLKSDEESFC